ncbi:endonuclease/exonuclease/phosphatase family protein [Danxiaibacter flavus]|uniref:Endonuclease/exonuclease/phosphatase family protein n=1 Tax=Danxiaibacter flavus TaxID=3049108 RepID=A0ABV3ZM28_9BACT|nr:endonuclease/exonuclease/phosphatase family protein [Chitinophagaceae bacterium DXS]
MIRQADPFLKSAFIGLFAVVLASSGCSKKQHLAASSSGRNELRVMTYNIHHANPPSKNGYIDVAAVAKVIKEQHPDFVALQEIDVNTKRSGLNEAAQLASQTGMNFYFAKAIDYDGGLYGVAVLSKFPLLDGRTISLPTLPGTKGEPRVLAVAEARISDNKTMLFASTHLDAQKDDQNRLAQIRVIVDSLSKLNGPIIIGGDFNATPESEVVKILDQHFTRTCVTGCGNTIPQINPKKTIDFIAFRGDDKLKVTSHKVIDEQYASDHLPVVATIGF